MNLWRRGEACGCPYGRQETTLQDKFLIAVVDDDASMREAVKGLLRSLGYDAVAFDSAEDFLNFDRRGPRRLPDRRRANAGADGTGPPRSADRVRRNHSDHLDHGLSRSTSRGHGRFEPA